MKNKIGFLSLAALGVLSFASCDSQSELEKSVEGKTNSQVLSMVAEGMATEENLAKVSEGIKAVAKAEASIASSVITGKVTAEGEAVTNASGAYLNESLMVKGTIQGVSTELQQNAEVEFDNETKMVYAVGKIPAPISMILSVPASFSLKYDASNVAGNIDNVTNGNFGNLDLEKMQEGVGQLLTAVDTFNKNFKYEAKKDKLTISFNATAKEILEIAAGFYPDADPEVDTEVADGVSCDVSVKVTFNETFLPVGLSASVDFKGPESMYELSNSDELFTLNIKLNSTFSYGNVTYTKLNRTASYTEITNENIQQFIGGISGIIGKNYF